MIWIKLITTLKYHNTIPKSKGMRFPFYNIVLNKKYLKDMDFVLYCC